MILCLDVGNSQIYGGVFKGEDIVLRFRKSSRNGQSSDETGVFLRSVLKENGLDPESVEKIAICTVVPESLHSLKNASRKYFGGEPFVAQSAHVLLPRDGSEQGSLERRKHEVAQPQGCDRDAGRIANVLV